MASRPEVMRMDAYEVRTDASDFSGLEVVDRDTPEPGASEALVRIRACSLNYRDLAIAHPELTYPWAELPVIPLSDGAGEVVKIGSEVEAMSIGDRVITPFAPGWRSGPPTTDKLATSVGANADGVLAEFATYAADTLTPLPEHLSFEEGSTLPCAGLTAWRALAEDGDLSAGEHVLVQGTGGVATFATQFSAMYGARPFVISASDDKLDVATALGATETLNYEATPDWGSVVSERTGGVDHVIEVAGEETIERSIEAIRSGGHIHMIGVLTGGKGTVDAYTLGHKRAVVNNVTGVGSVAMARRMCRSFGASGMTPYVDRVFDFADVQSAYRYLEGGTHQGKVVVRVT